MGILTLLLVFGLMGPLLARSKRLALPVAVGEIAIGAVFGESGFNLVPVNDQVLTFVSQVGFALVMMMVGSHIDIRALAKSGMLNRAIRNVALMAVAALALAFVFEAIGGLGLTWLFAVLIFSSSAAVILPALNKSELSKYSLLTSQIAIADLVSILVLPLAINRTQMLSTAIGALLIAALSLMVFFMVRYLSQKGITKKVRAESKERGFGLELRVSLITLLGIATLATQFGVTVLVAGFGVGLALAANGVPRRLAKQLFAVTEGFFAPVFFVMLGAQIDVQAALANPGMLMLAAAIFTGALIVHLVPVLFGFKPAQAVASMAQLGVPAAAVSIGQATGLLSAGQAAAIMLAALASILASVLALRTMTAKAISKKQKSK